MVEEGAPLSALDGIAIGSSALLPLAVNEATKTLPVGATTHQW